VEKPFVLLADDNEAACTLIRALLEPDFAVDVASDGAAAIEKLTKNEYAAILLDLLMPVVDGYSVLDFVRDQRPGLEQRILVVTAALSPREKERVRRYGVRAIIAKPFEIDALHAAVRDCAGRTGTTYGNGPLLAGAMILMVAAEVLGRV